MADEVTRQMREQREETEANLRTQLETALREATQQLEAVAHLPDLRGDLERVAAERDDARDKARGLQVRAEQAEGDARNAAAKVGNLQAEVVRLQAQLTINTDTLLRAEAANAALQGVILNLFREARGDD